ncbi:MAG: ATPase [Rhodobacteraceae bacterium]|nr:ATPase [Paracoccaceae bacterium]
MNSNKLSCLIGVDGGGTACRVALTFGGRRFDVALGPANAATDRLGAIATVRTGIALVAEQAGLDDQMLAQARVHVALAGIKSAADQRDVERGVKMQHVRVTEDQVSSLCGALGAMDGCIAALGTGSFLARQRDGRHHFIGGWGIALGDEASGAWLGRGLLAATLRAADGISDGSPLCAMIQARFGDPAGIMRFVAGASPGEIAELAPLVVQSAQQGDHVAQNLMQGGADYIGRGLMALGHETGGVIVLTGGLRDAYVPWLAAGLQADLRPRMGDALDGALYLAEQIGVQP